MGRREDEIGRYKDKYEESMNPFEAFKGRVSRVARAGVRQKLRLTNDLGGTKGDPGLESTGKRRVRPDKSNHRE
jgi:hypothetical protein